MLPFEEVIKNNRYLRTFKLDVSEEELVWHRDREDRSIIATSKTDWMIQYDNELPCIIPDKILLFIPKDTYHRLIKGSNELKLEIIKHS